MSKQEKNIEGKPLRIHDLDIQALSSYLKSKNIRTSQGKLYQELHDAHIEIIKDSSRFKVLACGRRFGCLAE
jgi:hypothetical protein